MKYKIGDKVKIKSWEEMKKAAGVENFPLGIERSLINVSPDRVLTIVSVKKHNYYIEYTMEEREWIFSENMIECKMENYKKPIPIISRFEILDI